MDLSCSGTELKKLRPSAKVRSQKQFHHFDIDKGKYQSVNQSIVDNQPLLLLAKVGSIFNHKRFLLW